jgi:cyclic pyranopterin phosphate synthase
MDDVVTAQEILAMIASQYPVRAIESNYRGEVAKRWSYADGGGEIGVIASVSQAFCHDCSRARLSTDGKLYTCLFATDGLELRAPLRRGESDAALRSLIVDAWTRRGDRYSELRHAATVQPLRRKIEMSYIGG